VLHSYCPCPSRRSDTFQTITKGSLINGLSLFSKYAPAGILPIKLFSSCRSSYIIEGHFSQFAVNLPSLVFSAFLCSLNCKKLAGFPYRMHQRGERGLLQIGNEDRMMFRLLLSSSGCQSCCPPFSCGRMTGSPGRRDISGKNKVQYS